jgi:hypothetical protein
MVPQKSMRGSGLYGTVHIPVPTWLMVPICKTYATLYGDRSFPGNIFPQSRLSYYEFLP